jgi:hypothetical protein
LEFTQSITSSTRARALQVGRVLGQVVLAREVLQDRRALGQAEVAVLEHRDEAARVDRGEGLLVVGAGEEVDHLLLDVEALLGDEEADRPARDRGGVHVELHGVSCQRV